MEFYLGIDFGTTNSAISRGGIDAYTSKILPEVVSVEMEGMLTEQQIVPSVALYKYGNRQVQEIGYAAKKHLIDANPLFKDFIAIKSVKLQLDKDVVDGAEWLKPEDVVSDILLFLKKSFEIKYELPSVERVVIGIPASFPSDMCEKTVKAGNLAGFKDVTLIPEPQAALLDFMLHQSMYAATSMVIDFSTPKNVMVFDLGGGTLDVSIAKVNLIEDFSQGKYKPEISYEALGISRFSDIGGDLFDKMFTDHLIDSILNERGINLYDIPNQVDRRRAISTVNEYSEEIKKHLTSRVSNKLKSNIERLDILDVMDSVSYHLAMTNIPLSMANDYRNQGLISYTQNIRYLDYVNVVKPLLGFELNLNDLNDDEKVHRLLYENNSKNIITPIFDALLQAKMSLGYLPRIDLILLNGGMSRMHIVKERIKKLFSTSIVLEITNPDLSVSKGSVIHNYNTLHNFGKSSNIISESILLEGSGGFIELIPAGTKYPTIEPIIYSRLFSIPRDNVRYINLPLYRGKNGTKIPIIDRVVHFDENATHLKKGDAIDFQIDIDHNRTLKFEAWLHDNPRIRFDVNLKL